MSISLKGALPALCLAFVAAATSPWARADADPGATTATIAASAAASDARLLRTALIVRDVERSQRFYAMLGYAPESSLGGPRDPTKTPFPLNVAAKQWRLSILASAANPGARLGLVSFDDPAPNATRAPGRKVGIGDPVLVFDVADAIALHARLKAAGADIVETPEVYLSRQLDASGRPLQGHVFHVFDPDGYLIELLEAPKPVAR
ncbi:MAG: VOC family protein [Steroidobacteraceae bacterium]|jgi:catechol 2,3-dioxygenase-like lactoylglutathione lyase family enzyme